MDLIFSICAWRKYSFMAGSLIILAKPLRRHPPDRRARCRSGPTSPRSFNSSFAFGLDFNRAFSSINAASWLVA